MKINYIGFYNSLSNNHEERNSVLSATNKMDYIIESLNEIGYKVNIISPSWTTNRKYYIGKYISLNENVNLKLFSTIAWKNKIQNLISVIFSFSQLFIYLFFNIKNTDQIIVYHSRWLSLPILMLKKIKKFVLILEVEEIYDDVKVSKIWKKFEYKLFEKADKYIFSTELLNEKVNKKNKPFTILYGRYKMEPNIKRKFEDNKIHVVYAGTLEPSKGSVLAVQSAKYLPSNFHVHIIGDGTKQDKDNLLKIISEISIKSQAMVSYDGLLVGEDFTEFMQKCDIGLSTQKSNNQYNETSFPSKILSYLTNGLKVVSINIKTIKMSALSGLISFYDEPDPCVIGDAIVSVTKSDNIDCRELINNLDSEFKINLKKLLEN